MRKISLLEFKETAGKEADKAVKVVLLPENGADLERIGKIASAAEIKMLKAAVKNRDFKFENEKKLVIDDGRQKFILFGVKNKPTAQEARLAGAAAAGMVKKDKEAALFLPAGWEKNAADAALGMELELYSFDKYFTRKKDDEFNQMEKVYLVPEKGGIDAKAMENMRALANGVRYARDLVNEPANFLTPEAFASDVERLRYLKLDVDILDEKELRKQDFNMLLEVAKGSEAKPRVGVIVWHGDKRRKETDVVLVGKGVTYDAGGINLKDRKNLANMYADMAGAAAVAATMKSIALERRVINVAAVVGLVENMPSGKALHPFDVIRSMSGQTVEVTDTDGEGRLLLADLLWYAQERFKPARIIDIATLTGSVAYALAGQYAGIFGNDKKLIRALTESGVECGEPLWELPLNETFDKWINSDVADMKNVGKNVGDGSQAAAFLQRYIKKGVSWAHIDMADMEIAGEDTELCPKGATGFGVQLLNQYLKNLGTEK